MFRKPSGTYSPSRSALWTQIFYRPEGRLSGEVARRSIEAEAGVLQRPAAAMSRPAGGNRRLVGPSDHRLDGGMPARHRAAGAGFVRFGLGVLVRLAFVVADVRGITRLYGGNSA